MKTLTDPSWVFSAFNYFEFMNAERVMACFDRMKRSAYTPQKYLASTPPLPPSSSPDLAPKRTTLLCYCFGASGAGKATLLRTLSESSPSREAPLRSSRPPTDIRCSPIDPEAQYYLAAQVFDPGHDEEVLSDKTRMQQCDVICWLYNTADEYSFPYILELMVRFFVLTWRSVMY